MRQDRNEWEINFKSGRTGVENVLPLRPLSFYTLPPAPLPQPAVCSHLIGRCSPPARLHVANSLLFGSSSQLLSRQRSPSLICLSHPPFFFSICVISSPQPPLHKGFCF